MSHARLTAALLLAAGLFTSASATQPTALEQKEMRLMSVVDADLQHQGKRGPILALLDEVLRESPESLTANLLAARVALDEAAGPGGSVRPEGADRAEPFIVAVLRQVPAYAPALSLRAEVEMARKQWPQARATLEQAKVADPRNPWVRLNLARYHDEMNDGRSGADERKEVLKWGEMGRLHQARAYSRAALELAVLFHQNWPDRPDGWRVYAEAADRTRHPGDARMAGELARLYFRANLLDEADVQARRSLAAVPGNAMGEQAMAELLYARAALARRDGTAGAEELVRQARSYRAHPGGTICTFLRSDAKLKELVPLVLPMLPAPVDRRTLVAIGCPAAHSMG